MTTGRRHLQQPRERAAITLVRTSRAAAARIVSWHDRCNAESSSDGAASDACANGDDGDSEVDARTERTDRFMRLSQIFFITGSLARSVGRSIEKRSIPSVDGLFDRDSSSRDTEHN